MLHAKENVAITIMKTVKNVVMNITTKVAIATVNHVYAKSKRYDPTNGYCIM